MSKAVGRGIKPNTDCTRVAFQSSQNTLFQDRIEANQDFFEVNHWYFINAEGFKTLNNFRNLLNFTFANFKESC